MSSLATTSGIPAAGAKAPAAGRRRRKQKKKTSMTPLQAKQKRLFWPFLLPAGIVYTIFLVGPTIASLWISLHSWDGVNAMQWVGLDNFKNLMHDDLFLSSLRNTFIILIGVGLAVFVVAFALTMVLREMAGRKFARSVIFFPNIVSGVVLSVLWGFLFQSNGIVDTVLKWMGDSNPPNFLGNHLFAIVCLGLMWINTGFYTTIIMAGVDQIPGYLYEECDLAGANAWQRFRFVTFPLTWDVIATAAVLWTISSLKVFDFLMAFGGSSSDLPNTSIWNTAMFVYGKTFGGKVPANQFGYASAAATVTLILVGVLVVLMRRLFKRDAIELS